MKTSIVIAASLVALFLASQAAKADGFSCVGQQTATHFNVFNVTDPKVGTRKPAMMVLSSPFVSAPNKTIAKFQAEYLSQKEGTDPTLHYFGYGLYEATVDLSHNDIHQGENIAGTKLGQLKKIILDLDFSYSMPVADGAKVAGTIQYFKLNGEMMNEKADCIRYLKK